MDRRELLDFAAKASGLSLEWNDYLECHIIRGPCDTWKSWTPLSDDGDALRLAVKLQLQITPGTYNKDEFMVFHAGRGEAIERWNTRQDEYDSTRLAIVRVAAEIGRSMP
jgi:hypothetical protein